MDKIPQKRLAISSHRMRNYRLILFLSCSVFLLTWLPHLLSSLLRAPQPFSDISLVCLSSGLLATPFIYPGQVKCQPVKYRPTVPVCLLEQWGSADYKEALYSLLYEEARRGGEPGARVDWPGGGRQEEGGGDGGEQRVVGHHQASGQSTKYQWFS